MKKINSLLLLYIFLFAACSSTDDQDSNLIEVGTYYADFEGLNLKEQATTLSDYIELDKYYLLEFWGVWCPYCTAEMDKLKEIRAAFDENQLGIIGVAIPNKNSADTFLTETKKYVTDHNLNWRHIMDLFRTSQREYGYERIPTFMLIGPNGKILENKISRESLKEILKKYIK